MSITTLAPNTALVVIDLPKGIATLPTDATTDARAEARAGSIANVFPRLGETGTTRDINAKLEAHR